MSKKADIIRKFREECRNVLKDVEGGLLVGISGGADSVALLLALKDAGLQPEAVHCNFHLRGKESDRDMEFVKELCEREEIPLTVIEFNVAKEKQKEESTEMACRRLRYDRFRSLLKEKGLRYLAVGHNADDNIETMLLNLLRGSGTAGLKAMISRKDDIVRPLLRFSRKEIEAYLREKGQSFVTDHTNLESDYRRNFLRNEVIPLLESRWAGARKAIGTSISLLREENRIIEEEINRQLKGNETFLSWVKINNFASPLTLIFRYINTYGGDSDIAEEITRSLPRPGTGKRWKLGAGNWAVSEKEGLRIINEKDSEPGWRIVVREIKSEGEELKELIPKDNDSALFPFPAERYEIRKAERGMKIEPFGMRGKQDVMKALKDAGIPAYRRADYPVVVNRESGEVVWIPGVKRTRKELVGNGGGCVLTHFHWVKS